jgi:hypothetical protein
VHQKNLLILAPIPGSRVMQGSSVNVFPANQIWLHLQERHEKCFPAVGSFGLRLRFLPSPYLLCRRFCHA